MDTPCGSTVGQLYQRGFEVFSTLTIVCNLLILWSGRPGSNRRHSAWEADVLPLNYSRPLESITYVIDSGLLSNLLSIQLKYPQKNRFKMRILSAKTVAANIQDFASSEGMESNG